MSVSPQADSMLVWLGRTRQAVTDFPLDVKREVGFALRLAQKGRLPLQAKPLTGQKAFKGAAVLEIVEDNDGNTYRTVYAAKFAEAVYILHAFQKNRKRASRPPAQTSS